MAVMPTTIKVGAHVYAVRRRSKEELEDLGRCDFDATEILIRKGLRQSKAREILLHEILHATTYPSMMNVEGLTDEQFVDSTAPVLLQVLQDNPQLVEYLTK